MSHTGEIEAAFNFQRDITTAAVGLAGCAPTRLG
jgi:hypothetical protein